MPKPKSKIAEWKEQQKLANLRSKLQAKKEKVRKEREQLEVEMDEDFRQENLAMDEREKEFQVKKKEEERKARADDALRQIMLKKQNEDKMKRLDEIIENLLMVASGVNVKETTILFDAERHATKTFQEVETMLPITKRVNALEVLWAVSFKGDAYKRNIVNRGGIDILFRIMEEFWCLAAHLDKEEERNMYQNAFSCVSSLAINPDVVPVLSRLKTSEYCLELLSDPRYAYTWAAAFETLGSMSEGSKLERKKMQTKPMSVIERILGTKRGEGAWDLDSHVGYIQHGTEDSTLQALKLVENLLTREEVRIMVLERTRAPLLFKTILNLENIEVKASVCRIIGRLCNSQWCRERLKLLGLEDLICDAFCTASNGYAQAATGVAFSALVSSTDEITARKAAPRALTIILAARKNDAWDFVNITFPAVLHVVRSLARHRFVQDLLVDQKCVSQLILMIKTPTASSIAKEHAMHVIGSIALQSQYNKQLRDFHETLAVVLTMVKTADMAGKAVAARTLQHLTSCEDNHFRFQVSDFKHVSLDKTGSNAAEIWTGMGAIVALLQADMSQQCWEHGAGIVRNMTCLEEIREKMMKDPGGKDSCLYRLSIIIQKGTVLAKMHAAAALGNFSNTDTRRGMVVKCGAKVLIELLKRDNNDADVPPQDAEFLNDMRECAATTLGICSVYHGAMEGPEGLIKFGLVPRLATHLTGRAKSLRLFAAVALRNVSAHEIGAIAICKDGVAMAALEKAIRLVDDVAFINQVVPTVANLALFKENFTCVVTHKMCRGLVNVLRNAPMLARASACNFIKSVAQSMIAYFLSSLVDASVIPALVALLQVEMDVQGGCAQCAAGAIARLCIADDTCAGRVADVNGIGLLVFLLRAGCAGAREQASKSILIICEADAYRLVLLQIGGLDAARAAMVRQESDQNVARQVLDLLANTNFESGQASIVERKKLERTATRNTNAIHFWEKEDQQRAQRGLHGLQPYSHISSPIQGSLMRASLRVCSDRAASEIDDYNLKSPQVDSTPRTPGSSKRVTFSRESNRWYRRNSGSLSSSVLPTL